MYAVWTKNMVWGVKSEQFRHRLRVYREEQNLLRGDISDGIDNNRFYILHMLFSEKGEIIRYDRSGKEVGVCIEFWGEGTVDDRE
jgi:hypothetical protein